MFKRLQALLWSRKEILLANKQTSIMLIFPLMFAGIYSFIFKDMLDSNKMIFTMILPMLTAMIGYLLPILIAEEVEKNNQRSLLMAGVKYEEYIFSNLVIPFMAVLIYLLSLPFMLRVSIENWTTYLLVNIVTTIVVFILYTAIALLCDTQAKASMAAMPIMMVNLLLPIAGMTSESISEIADYTYMGAFSQWRETRSDYALTDKTFFILLIWLVISVLVAGVVIRRKKVIE
ncbi:ABC transporter permease [Streptococcus merionis]|uniref:ABC transporter permease n=1 Tax=Streptococcus merionis TaxID=400065 RepID=UPI0026F00B56|nr:ABC transporter permease [Streptococcus merionis]